MRSQKWTKAGAKKHGNKPRHANRNVQHQSVLLQFLCATYNELRRIVRTILGWLRDFWTWQNIDFVYGTVLASLKHYLKKLTFVNIQYNPTISPLTLSRELIKSTIFTGHSHHHSLALTLIWHGAQPKKVQIKQNAPRLTFKVSEDRHTADLGPVSGAQKTNRQNYITESAATTYALDVSDMITTKGASGVRFHFRDLRGRGLEQFSNNY